MRRQRRFKELEARLGYKFKSEALAEQALTHSSTRGGKSARSDNERLEFLGDRVLGLVVAELIGELMPKAREGELAKRFNLLVRRETCAQIGRDIGLGPFLVVSAGEEESGGREKDTILADATEALLAAIYLDGGFAKARDIVRRLWEPYCRDMAGSGQDAKSALQEWAQGQGLPLPVYRELARTGPDHAPVFTAEVRIEGVAAASGQGSSKRIAEQAAATAMLSREGMWSEKS